MTGKQWLGIGLIDLAILSLAIGLCWLSWHDRPPDIMTKYIFTPDIELVK